ncbi:hypothetical protein Aperf_G00000053944 [Anoplocephala perfoliata]
MEFGLPSGDASDGCPFCKIKGCEDSKETENAIFSWLDSNPSVLHNYIYSHASQNVVEDLVRASAFKISKILYPSQHRVSSVNSLIASQEQLTDMPIRKISSSEFESLAFHPILSTGRDGCQSFLASLSLLNASSRREHLQEIPSESVSSEISGLPSNGSSDQNEKLEEKNSLADSFAEFYSSDMFQELVLDIWRDSDLSSLCFKILRNACLLLNADRASLFLVEINSSTGERFLVSRLFDVTAKSTFADVMGKSSEMISLPFGVGIIGWVAQAGEGVNISNVYEVSLHLKLIIIF